jgi:hypothetical protein
VERCHGTFSSIQKIHVETRCSRLFFINLFKAQAHKKSSHFAESAFSPYISKKNRPSFLRKFGNCITFGDF